MPWYDKPNTQNSAGPLGTSARPKTSDAQDRDRHRRFKKAVFAERAPANKAIPAWIAEQDRRTASLSGWLSNRPPPMRPSVAPPPEVRVPEGRAAEPRPEGHRPSRFPSQAPPPVVNSSPEAMDARALTLEQSERLSPAAPSSPPFESLAQHLPEATAFEARENVDVVRLEQAIGTLESSIDELTTLRTRILAETEEQLVILAGAIARRVMGREAVTDGEVMAALAAEGIDALGERDRVLVRVGAVDGTELLPQMVERLRRRNPRCEVILDPTLDPGQCMVESEFGFVDESIDARLANVMRAILRPEGT